MKLSLRPIKSLVLALVACSVISNVTGQTDSSANEPESPPVTSEISMDEWMRKAQTEYLKGNLDEAIKIMDQALESQPDNYQGRFSRARLLVTARRFDEAIADYDALIEKAPQNAIVYHHRGEAHFRSGALTPAFKDFNEFLRQSPLYAPQHWQRGIVCYYLGNYKEGVEQFETHQTVNPSDVENAVWHFMCLARLEDPASARKRLIPIGDDYRVPMMEIYALFKGNGSVEEVLAAARKGKDSIPEEQWRNQMFYAYQYIGLYYEAYGLDQNARQAMKKAATEFAMDHYMGDVARVHWGLMQKNVQAAKAKPELPEKKN